MQTLEGKKRKKTLQQWTLTCQGRVEKKTKNTASDRERVREKNKRKKVTSDH
jgi:hypothetical protein